MVTKFLRENIIPKTDEEIILQTEADKKAGIGALQAGQMLIDDTYQLAAAATKPFREQGPIDLAMKIPSLATEEGRKNLGKYMLDLIDFEKYGRPIDKFTGYMEEDDPDIKNMRDAIYFGSLVPSVPGLLKLSAKVARFAAPVAGPAIPFIAAGGMGEAEAATLFTKAPKIVEKVQDLIKPTVSGAKIEAPGTATTNLTPLNTYDRALAEQLEAINNPNIKAMDVKRSLVKPANKKIFDYLDNLLKTGQPLVKRKAAKDLNVARGKRGTIEKIVEKYYPNKFEKLTDEQIQKIKSERMMETFAARRAEEVITEPTPRRIGGERVTQVDFPNEKMREDYIADLKDIFNNPQTSGTNTKLAKKFFGEATPSNVTKVERINQFFIKELNLIKPMADPSASGQKRLARIKAAEKFLSDEEIEIVRRQNRQITIANKYYAANPEEILNNPKFMELLNAKLVNGKIVMKDPITLEKAKELTKKGLFDIFHVSPVASEKRNIMFPSNILVSPGRINQGFNTSVEAYFKNTKGSTDPEVIKNKQAISDFYEKFGLTFETVDGRIGAKMLPAINRETNKLTSIDNVFEKMNVPQIIDSSRYVSRQELDKIDFKDVIGEFSPVGAKTATTYGREDKFQEGTQDITSFDQFGDVPGTINASIKSVQEQVKSMYNDERVDFIREPLERYNLEAQEIQEELQKRLNPPQPVKFKFSELPKLVTESPILRSFLGDPRVYGLETAELFYNAIRPGVENDVEMEKLFPGIYAMHTLATGTGVDPTPKEQTYISLIDEINRAQEKGLANFGYNVADLALSIPDAVLPTEFTEEVKRQYEEMDLAEPETFIGNIGALAVEFGIPGSIAFKIINRFKKSISAATKGKADKYLFTRKSYGLEGLPKYGVQISNIAKRAGTTSLAFGAADFVAGGPYNTLTSMFDDPLLSSKLVGQLEDVENLTGKERVAANFRNRLRYGAEGSLIGGVFPLVGPALGAIGKNVLLKPALFLGKYGVVYPANYLAIKPATYLASKDPLFLPGLARGAGAFAQFLGKDVLARLAATAATGGKAFVPSLKGNLGQLPDFQQWRMFDIASNDPLERGLRKVDNFLKWFRDSGNQALYSFNLSGGAERFIKAKTREIEKYLDAVERKAYDLANGFLKRYNTSTTSPAGERHMLEQVYEYLRGNLKLSKLEPELQDISKSLKNEFDQIKKAFVGELPEKSGLRAFLESNLDKYMRASFGVFTNPRFTPADDVVERATDFMVNVINKNEDFIEAAVRGVPVTEQAQAIRAFAKTNVENMINLGKREGIDPIVTLKQINRQILRDDDAVIQTGEELPKVIRELLGEEKSLRASVMTTAGSLVTQTTNLRAFKEIAKHGLDNGYLFTSRAEALAAGVTDPLPIGGVPGLGGLQDLATADKGGPIGLFASREMKNTLEGTGGMLDSLLQNSFYQSLIAYKAGVQTGKTVFSPATQTRNFGSAGFFPLNVGHIGGNASVTDAFKIVMDDIFGAGRVVNEADLIKRISRKIELGVLDENIVASELSAILQDIKGGKLKALGALSDRVDSSKLFKTATRVYAGGDNVWKWYGHEFYMSQLKGAFKSFDDVKRYMKDFHGVDISNRNIFGGGAKNLDDGIEEAAAYLLRETYPTYSKVPEFIKAIRKLPIGNFVSFTSEILRTSFATSAIALKHVASDNPVLREMGYRALAGQAITLGGVTAGVQGLAHAMTNVTPTQLEVYKQYFAPDYMKFSSLIPVTNVEDGVFEVFDISRYHPYDIVTSSARELFKTADRQFHDERIARLTEQLKTVDPGSDEGKRIRDQIKDLSIKARMGQTLDPDKITINALTQYLNAVGPLYNAVTGTFFGIPIGAEAFLEAARGKTLEGSTIWNTSMPPTEIFDRAMGHFFKTIEPGLISSGRKLLYAARGDVSGVGQPLEVNTEVFKLMGGSNVKVDILGSLDFKISGDFLASFREPKMGRDYYDTANFQQRGPEQLVREYRKQNEDAFRMQYEFYKAAEAAIDSGLLTRTQIIQALQKRIAPDSKSISQKVASFISGRYTPITYGPEGLKSRREKIIRRNPDLDQSVFNYQYFLPIGLLEREKLRWTGLKFEDFEREQETQQQESSVVQPVTTPVAQTPEIQTPPVQETGAPVVAPQPVAGVNPMTGLTTTETALLSPGEAAIRQRQRTTGIA